MAASDALASLIGSLLFLFSILCILFSVDASAIVMLSYSLLSLPTDKFRTLRACVLMEDKYTHTLLMQALVLVSQEQTQGQSHFISHWIA